MDTARHVLGCRLTQKARVRNACDDVACTIHQSLGGGAGGQALEDWIRRAVRSEVDGRSGVAWQILSATSSNAI